MPTYLNPCPSWDYARQTWWQYCLANSTCPSCQSVLQSNSNAGQSVIVFDGARTGGGIENRPDELLLTEASEWVVLTPLQYEQLQQDLATFEATLSQDPIERDLALAQFYGDRGVELMRIQMLDSALFASRDHLDIRIAEELAGALERAGFMEAALQTWDVVPAMIPEFNLQIPDLFGQAQISRARILESLDLHTEAETALASARHWQATAAQLRALNLQP